MQPAGEETQSNGGALSDESHGHTDQTRALLAILELGRQEIETGNFTPAREVFAELEAMDKDAGII